MFLQEEEKIRSDLDPNITIATTTVIADEHLDKRILFKIDPIVLTLVTLVATLEFLDKNGLAYAAVFGLKTDTNLVGQEYSWLGSIFYFGYLAALVPCLYLVNVVHTGRFIGALTTLWGITIMCMAACHNFAGLATVRFFLGIFESGILPCFMVLQAKWWRRPEQALRTALWYNTFAGIFGGILSFAIGHINGKLAVWKYIFLIYGSVTILVGIVVFFALPDSPATAWFLKRDEKLRGTARLAENQQGQEKKKFDYRQCLELVKDPKYWVVVLFVVAQAITNAGITNFNPLIISGFGYSKSKTTLMATPQAAVAFVAQVILSSIVLFVPNIRCLLWVLSCLPALTGAVMVHTIDRVAHRYAALTGVYLMGFYNVPWVLCLSLVTSNNAGTTKKTFASISVATAYAVGNIIGPQFFRSSQAPTYNLGIYAMMVCFAIMCVCGGVYWGLVKLENNRRDRLYGKPLHDTQQIIDEAYHTGDTDVKNRNFRYSW
ncbi:uncharacterized protein I206_106268 [Kwoniella pini CBS 10737]|uniref:Major facilitator superfamily (MFS) profile domain-containing protein n=1 Tax=Kwoniella pini CBS 10737 TaxID=1296096 RepID=A0A1B9I1R6_9TREE|nr:uncharacterized protein I206_05094 [Kwoniella pini CBS 10737]OCF49401.1 hypothetical protein I206_05094 [Kwoniella pini CBS 10737]